MTTSDTAREGEAALWQSTSRLQEAGWGGGRASNSYIIYKIEKNPVGLEKICHLYKVKNVTILQSQRVLKCSSQELTEQ